jgi:hypothetical protein
MIQIKKYLLCCAAPIFLGGCIKQQPTPALMNIKGTYKVQKVIRQTTGNYQTEIQQYYANGQLFVNNLEIPGLDSLYTDFSCLKIEDNHIHLQQVVSGQDTIWKHSYVAQNEISISPTNPYYVFYPLGSKRTWHILDCTDSSLTVLSSTQWPQGNLGAAYTTTLVLQKK